MKLSMITYHTSSYDQFQNDRRPCVVNTSVKMPTTYRSKIELSTGHSKHARNIAVYANEPKLGSILVGNLEKER